MWKALRIVGFLAIWICCMPSEVPASLQNVALGKPASSNSYAADRTKPEKAVDGIVDGTSYFQSEESDTEWWRVDMGEDYFILDIRVYNVYAKRQFLEDVEIYTSSEVKPIQPPPDSNWTLVKAQATITAARLNNYIQYDPVADSAIIPLARHVAVLTKKVTLVIDEVQVYAYTTAEFVPLNLKLESSGVGCVTLGWSPPTSDSNVRVSYQVMYNDGEWSDEGEPRITTKCNLPANHLLKCKVRVDRAPTTDFLSGEIRTPCDKPSQPQSLNLDTKIVNCATATPSWEYKVTWKEPDNSNCNSIAEYKTKYTSSSTSDKLVTTTSRVVYAGVEEEITLSVSARNDAGNESAVTSKTITTPAISPTFMLCKSTQSSSKYGSGYESWRAVDGDSSGVSYFRSADERNAWWRVDMGSKYFVKEIKVFNVYNFRGRLQKVGIYLSSNENPSDPSSSNSDWTLVRNQSDYITSSEPDNYLKYDPLSPSRIISLTRHVAVYTTTSDGLIIDDVQVTTFTKAEFKPTNPSMSICQNDPLCVLLKWDPPKGNNAIKTNYEVNCNNNPGWRTPNGVNQDTIQSLQPQQTVQCDVQVKGTVDVVSSQFTTPCTPPSKPRTLSIGSPLMNCNTGTPRWQYRATWVAPESSNCDSVTGYRTRFPSTSSSVEIVYATNRDVYTSSGARVITFDLSAVNNKGKISESITAIDTTPIIAQNLTLCKPTSSSSEYKTSGYEDWRAVDGDITARSYFRSDNSNSQWWKMDLQDNYFIHDIKVYNAFSIPERLQKATIYVSDKKTSTIPSSDDWTVVKDQGNQIASSPPNNYMQYDPVTATDIVPLARYVAVYSTYTGGLAIDDVQVMGFSTDEYKPTSPNMQIKWVDMSCVILRWNPPTGNNRIKAIYETICEETNWKSVGEKRTREKCGLSPNQLVKCKVRVKGATDYMEKEIRTPCAPPTSPRLIDIGVPSMNCATGGPRWQYNMIWQIPQAVNCDSITNYMTRFPGDGNSTVLNSGTNAVVYTAHSTRSLTFSVSARNNQGNESAFKSVTFTSPQIEKTVTLCKPTLRSSVFKSTAYESWRAVDGDIAGTTYFRSAYSSPQWWTVNLEETFFIREVRVYNVPNYRGSLRKVGVYVSNKHNPAEPPAGADWSRVIYQSDFLTTSPPDNYIKYDPVDESHIIPLARHVALYSTWKNGMVVAEVQIQALNTLEFKPTSLNLSLSQSQTSDLSSCVTMNWEPPINAIDVMVLYEVMYGKYDWKSVGEKRTDMRCGLELSQRWICRVRVVGAVGDVFGLKGAPCVEPSAPKVTVMDTVEVDEAGYERVKMLIQWQEPKSYCESISRYEVNITSGDILLVNTSTVADVRNLTIGDLDPATEYRILVRVVNNDNLDNDTELVWLTRELKPADLPYPQLTFNATCVSAEILQPLKPNGIVTHYTVGCHYSGLQNSPTNLSSEVVEGKSVELCDLTSASQITCKVSAWNTAGESRVRTTHGYTRLLLVDPQAEHVVVTPEEGMTKVFIKPVELANGTVSTYQLVVSKDGVKVRRKRSPLVEGRECYSDKLYSAKLSSVNKLDCYVTAEINASSVTVKGLTFNMGSGSNVGGHHNAPLEPNSEYALVVGLIVNVKGDEPLTHYLEPVSFKTRALTSCQLGCQVGVSVGVCCLVLIGLAGVMIYRRRRANGQKSQKRASHEHVPLSEREPNADEEGSEYSPGAAAQQSGNDIYVNVTPRTQRKNAIPVSSLPSHIATSPHHILEEYTLKVEKQGPPTMAAALLPENKGKCRYVRLYPADSHRVQLSREPEEGTDFINASFIAGYGRGTDKAFIAAQGPMKKTLDDFWLMIWQQRPKAIVMVTGVVENGKPKCEQYWPDNIGTSMKYNGIEVTLASCETWADYTLRTLRVTKEGKTVNMKHFQYTSWPDHGVPAEMSPFVIFVRKVKDDSGRCSGPLLVHCSAGVGRTGTFIALDNLIAEAKDQGSVDVMECVRKMRERRPKMIQAKEQYLFLHRVLNEMLLTETFPCSPNNVGQRLALYRANKTFSNDVITREFERMEENLGLLTPDFSMAKEEENQMKNRYPDILPDRKHSVYSGGNYINAILVDDYKKQRHVIATQLPLANTMNDFWALIVEQEVKVIVQLEHEDEEFYPVEKKKFISCGEFDILCKDVEVKGLASIISLTLSKGSKVIASSITVLKIDNWTTGTERFPDCTSLTSYLGFLEKCQQQTGDEKICVVDMDGSTRCGIFIAAYNAIEKVKSEQEVDMYNSVLMARYRRKEFVGDIESYVYLYNLLKDFTDAFSEYANFQ